jgi:hypothetical protein
LDRRRRRLRRPRSDGFLIAQGLTPRHVYITVALPCVIGTSSVMFGCLQQARRCFLIMVFAVVAMSAILLLGFMALDAFEVKLLPRRVARNGFALSGSFIA